MPNRLSLLFPVLLIFSGLASAADSPVGSCAGFRLLKLPDVTITTAENIAAGKFTPPNLNAGEALPPIFQSAPAFCRVTATLAPTPDSDIKLEVWLPAEHWNGKFRGVGNGGFGGYINYPELAAAVSLGYAAASTDTGHSTEGGGQWALGRLEKFVDYGYRAIHEMTVNAKAIAHEFYGAAPQKSYFSSCSNGGRQALMEAQRFPDDYDGIIAGAPANRWVPMLTAGLQMLQHTEGHGYISAAKIPVISQAVLAACDSQDGLKDGILNDPRQCHFDPSTLLCKGTSSDACLTQPQVDSLKQIYAGGHDASGEPIFPGLLPGAEEGQGGWEPWITGDAPGKSLADFYVLGFFTNMVYGDKDWDFRKANIDASLKLATEKAADTMNANNADLKAFRAHGGKLILYHGWNDPAISSLNTIDYYNRVISALGNDSVQQFVRLYMVPGMQHCMGGRGATVFGQASDLQRAEGDTGPDRDIFTALVQWVESGQAPGKLIATRYREDDPAKGVQMTRPLCIYPQSAKYNGSGDPDRASSFTCSLGK